MGQSKHQFLYQNSRTKRAARDCSPAVLPSGCTISIFVTCCEYSSNVYIDIYLLTKGSKTFLLQQHTRHRTCWFQNMVIFSALKNDLLHSGRLKSLSEYNRTDAGAPLILGTKTANVHGPDKDFTVIGE